MPQGEVCLLSPTAVTSEAVSCVGGNRFPRLSTGAGIVGPELQVGAPRANLLSDLGQTTFHFVFLLKGNNQSFWLQKDVVNI